MKKIIILTLILCMIVPFTGCNSNESNTQTTILVAAAASLKNCMDDEIIPLFSEQNPNIKVNTTYDGSGKLQTQIEEGAQVDVFISAAMKQMNTLNERDFILENSIVELLENRIVLIVPKGSNNGIYTFQDILKANTIAIGDPESVPAGQYAKEVFENINIWEDVLDKASLASNVNEVLNWVAEGSADAGIVYATDAAGNDRVKISLEAPIGSVSKIIYPIGIVKTSENKDEAKVFTDFLQSDEAMKIFETYGFTPMKQEK